MYKINKKRKQIQLHWGVMRTIPENLDRIKYDGKWHEVDEVESDHIHLDDGTVIRNYEIKRRLLGGYKSNWSEMKDIIKSESSQGKPSSG